MRSSGIASALVLTALLLASQCVAHAAERMVVPIKQSVLSDGDIRYSIPVVIAGGDPIDAMLDTGSTGLRILQGTVAETLYSVSDRTSLYRYGSGARLHGVIARAVVTVGGAATDAPIPLEIVQSVDCAGDTPRCPAARVRPEEYRIGGNGLPNQGFRAIVGINMGRADAVNPLSRIGMHAWLVLLPRPGERNPGTLIINPDDSDRNGFALFHTDDLLGQLPGAGGYHDAIAGCLVGEDGRRRVCGPTLLETGVPGLHLSSSEPSDLSGWHPGSRAQIAFTSDQGTELDVTLTEDADRSSRITTELKPNQPRARIAAGTLPYFTLAVLYDGEHSMIGLKPR
jgi:hypothetical protein